MASAVSLGAVSVDWWLGLVPPGALALGFGSGLVVSAAVGLRQARRAAGAVCREQALAAERLVAQVESVGAGLAGTADVLRRGGRPRIPDDRPVVPDDGTPFVAVERALARLDATAANTVVAAHERSQLAVRHAMFRHIFRREHALILRLLEALEDLQNEIKSAALLNRVFRIDNLAVRLRRWSESLAILGGESASTVRYPVTVTTVLRAAVQEIQQYERARVVPGSYGPLLGLPGHAAPDITHLVAELVENATEFSAPNTLVYLRAQLVSGGLLIEIVDRARQMMDEDRAQMNAVLAAPERVDVTAQLADGRIGLLVVGMTAARHGIHVSLAANADGGNTAQVLIPQRLLVTAEPEPVPAPRVPSAPRQVRPAPVPSSGPARLTAGGLPRRARSDVQPPDAPSGLPVRARTDSSVRPYESPARSGAVTGNPGLAGAFRRGTQGHPSGDPAPRQTPEQ
ncbi:ATP-binding protein [Streptomyces sp. NPDC059894]|uniref:ATP-binding protein n=1 Tax=unclassified Streptomyces TaxID=2593676 RepID=UPI003653CD31